MVIGVAQVIINNSDIDEKMQALLGELEKLTWKPMYFQL